MNAGPRLWNFTCLHTPSGSTEVKVALLVFFAEGERQALETGQFLFSQEVPGGRVIDEALSQAPDVMILRAANYILVDMDRAAMKGAAK